MNSEQEPAPTPPPDSPPPAETEPQPTPSGEAPAPSSPPEPEPASRELDIAFFAKLLLLLFVIAYATAFVVGNDKRISVDFVFATGRVSLIWAVLLLLLVGLGCGLLLSHLYRHRRSKQSREP